VEGHEYISPENVIQRPKVQYSEADKKYHVSHLQMALSLRASASLGLS
jgi:hypothetical protein